MILDKDVVLETKPHYSDKRFKRERTVFGRPSKSPYGHSHLSYDYSDRLWEWDSKKSEESAKKAYESGFGHKTCHWYEEYLSHYFGKKVVIEHIIAGVNQATGYPYAVYGYRDA